MPTEEQYTEFENLLKVVREEFPEALDYNLQLLCWKYVLEGTLEGNKENVEELKKKYDNTTTHFKTPV